MTSTEFAYWLQGFLELSDPKALDEKQIAMIRRHLNLVFTNVTNTSTSTKGLQSQGIRDWVSIC